MPSPYKEYLGDGVYADFDGYQIVLTTENGEQISNTIYLEESTFDALVAYRERLVARNKAEQESIGEKSD